MVLPLFAGASAIGMVLTAWRAASVDDAACWLCFDVEHNVVGSMTHHSDLGHRPIPSVHPL